MKKILRFVKKGFLYIYYKFVQARSLLKMLVQLHRCGVRKIFSSTPILSDGTPIHFERTYYDYLVLCENVFTRVYEKYLPAGFSPKVILDLGAHKGFFSIMAAKKFPDAQIYAVEPNIKNYNFLLENTKSFPSIHPIHAAVWSDRRKISLHIGGSAGHSLFKMYGRTGVIESVDTVTLDDLPAADFIKCDIEGSENVLTFNAPYIALEVHTGIEGVTGDVIENLKTSGYSICYEPPIAYASLPQKAT